MRAPNGDLFVSDTDNNRIRQIRSPFVPRVLSAASAIIDLRPAVTIDGMPGGFYRVESALDATSGTWREEISFQLPKSPFVWIDQNAAVGPRKFYRVVAFE